MASGVNLYFSSAALINPQLMVLKAPSLSRLKKMPQRLSCLTRALMGLASYTF